MKSPHKSSSYSPGKKRQSASLCSTDFDKHELIDSSLDFAMPPSIKEAGGTFDLSAEAALVSTFSPMKLKETGGVADDDMDLADLATFIDTNESAGR